MKNGKQGNSKLRRGGEERRKGVREIKTEDEMRKRVRNGHAILKRTRGRENKMIQKRKDKKEERKKKHKQQTEQVEERK